LEVLWEVGVKRRGIPEASGPVVWIIIEIFPGDYWIVFCPKIGRTIYGSEAVTSGSPEDYCSLVLLEEIRKIT
jgi:hypothetical protein